MLASDTQAVHTDRGAHIRVLRGDVLVGAEGYLPTDNFSPRQTTEMDLFERGDNMIAVTCITVG